MSDFNADLETLPQGDPRRLQDLAAGVVIGDLDDQEWNELQQWSNHEFAPLVEEFDRVAANIFLVMAENSRVPAIPTALAGRISEQGREYFRKIASDSTTKSIPSVALPKSTGRMGRREVIAWLCVAASTIALAGLNLMPRSVQQQTASLQQQWDTLSSRKDIVRVSWEPGTTPVEGKVTGEVLWSTAEQRGFMSFVGLPANDPSREQYQLWIIDPSRDTKPVDGGVFDIRSADVRDGKVIVPIHAKLQVDQPAVFALTVEKPGGVVVSSQERLPLIAKVSP